MIVENLGLNTPPMGTDVEAAGGLNGTWAVARGLSWVQTFW
jgi:hypothetical protein